MQITDLEVKNISNPFFQIWDVGDIEKFQIDLNFDVKVAKPQKLLIVDVNINYLLKVSRKPFLGATVRTIYGINEDCLVDDLSFEGVPEEMMITAVSLAISHSRAILAMRTAGTEQSKFYLPLFNPAAIVKTLNRREVKN
jgi:hypothetical protein